MPTTIFYVDPTEGGLGSDANWGQAESAPFKTILRAIQASGRFGGATISLGSGTYYETINFGSQRAANGLRFVTRGPVIIDGQNIRPCIWLSDSVYDTSYWHAFEGIHFKNGYSGGIHCAASYPLDDWGTRVGGSMGPTFSDCQFSWDTFREDNVPLYYRSNVYDLGRNASSIMYPVFDRCSAYNCRYLYNIPHRNTTYIVIYRRVHNYTYPWLWDPYYNWYYNPWTNPTYNRNPHYAYLPINPVVRDCVVYHTVPDTRWDEGTIEAFADGFDGYAANMLGTSGDHVSQSYEDDQGTNWETHLVSTRWDRSRMLPMPGIASWGMYANITMQLDDWYAIGNNIPAEYETPGWTINLTSFTADPAITYTISQIDYTSNLVVTNDGYSYTRDPPSAGNASGNPISSSLWQNNVTPLQGITSISTALAFYITYTGGWGIYQGQRVSPAGTAPTITFPTGTYALDATAYPPPFSYQTHAPLSFDYTASGITPYRAKGRKGGNIGAIGWWSLGFSIDQNQSVWETWTDQYGHSFAQYDIAEGGVIQDAGTYKVNTGQTVGTVVSPVYRCNAKAGTSVTLRFLTIDADGTYEAYYRMSPTSFLQQDSIIPWDGPFSSEHQIMDARTGEQYLQLKVVLHDTAILYGIRAAIDKPGGEIGQGVTTLPPPGVDYPGTPVTPGSDGTFLDPVTGSAGSSGYSSSYSGGSVIPDDDFEAVTIRYDDYTKLSDYLWYCAALEDVNTKFLIDHDTAGHHLTNTVTSWQIPSYTHAIATEVVPISSYRLSTMIDTAGIKPRLFLSTVTGGRAGVAIEALVAYRILSSSTVGIQFCQGIRAGGQLQGTATTLELSPTSTGQSQPNAKPHTCTIIATSGQVTSTEVTAVTDVGPPSSITITPGYSTCAGGQSAPQQFIATATYPGNITRDVSQYCDWTLADPRVGALTAGGLFTPALLTASLGYQLTSNISCSLRGIVSNTVSITITGTVGTSVGTITRTELTPQHASLGVDGSCQFSLIQYGSNFGLSVDRTANAVWACSDAQVGAFAVAPAHGLFVASANLTKTTTAIISATYAGITKFCLVTVSIASSAQLTSIAITPVYDTIPNSADMEYQAIGTWNDGTTSDITGAVTWSLDSDAIGALELAEKPGAVLPEAYPIEYERSIQVLPSLYNANTPGMAITRNHGSQSLQLIQAIYNAWLKEHDADTGESFGSAQAIQTSTIQSIPLTFAGWPLAAATDMGKLITLGYVTKQCGLIPIDPPVFHLILNTAYWTQTFQGCSVVLRPGYDDQHLYCCISMVDGTPDPNFFTTYYDAFSNRKPNTPEPPFNAAVGYNILATTAPTQNTSVGGTGNDLDFDNPPTVTDPQTASLSKSISDQYTQLLRNSILYAQKYAVEHDVWTGQHRIGIDQSPLEVTSVDIGTVAASSTVGGIVSITLGFAPPTAGCIPVLQGHTGAGIVEARIEHTTTETYLILKTVTTGTTNLYDATIWKYRLK